MVPVVRKDVVLVTGFGPFGTHKINASWESVKLLVDTGIEEDLGIKLITKEIPVDYDFVKKNVPEMWEMYKPKLVIHVGVSGVANEVNLEQMAFNGGYNSPDVQLCLPQGNCCIPGAQDCIISGINMRKICEDINHSTCGVFSCVSSDPGRYLCDFIYYTSLSIDRNRTAFIHVPVLNKPYNSKQLAEALSLAIKSMYKEVHGDHVL
nr:EOG090X0F1W [Sida crystallina]